jgi:hypothetical protein
MRLKLAALLVSLAAAAGAAPDDANRSALVPADVRAALAAAGPKAARSCAPRGLGRYLSVRPPSRIAGYNSRMDNADRVPGARQMNQLVLDLSATAAWAFASGDGRAKDEILSVLAHLARSGAWQGTKSCVRGGQLLDSCTEWTRPDGQDLSAMKDFSTVQMAVAALQRAYWLAAAGHRTKDRAADHAAIREWFAFFDKRMKSPTAVYFGLGVGWHWPAIDAAAARRGPAGARGAAGKTVRGLGRLFLDDGAIRDITTRGNRALHYHSSALNETLVSMEMLRAAGGTVPSDLEAKLHRAVRLFIAGVQDPAALDPWAREAHNAIHTPGRQEFDRNWWNRGFAGSWWHIYAFRYPDRAEAQWLRAAAGPTSGSARADEQVGVALGCIYRAAAG